MKFGKKTAKISTGTIISQILNLLLLPIIANIIGPEEFGIFGYFFAAITIVSTTIFLRYEQAIIIIDNRYLSTLISSCILFSLSISLILFIIILISVNVIELLYEYKSILLFLPVAILGYSIINLLLQYFLRDHRYYMMSLSIIGRNLFILISYIWLQIKIVENVMIWSMIINSIIVIIIFFFIIIRDKLMNSKNIKRILIRYISFPKYNLISILFFNIILHSPIYIIGILYGNSSAGIFNLGFRIATVPISLFAIPLTHVLSKEIFDLVKIKSSDVRKILLKRVIQLFSFSIVIYICLAVVSDFVVDYYFSSDWAYVDDIIYVLILYGIIRFVGSSFSNILNVIEQQKVFLKWQVSHLMFTLVVLYTLSNIPLSLIYYVGIALSLISIPYLYLLYLNYRIIGRIE